MEILKSLRQLMAMAILLGLSLTSGAQEDDKTLKAFEDSYASETKGDYAGAIASLKSIYDEKSYEINIRLGWLNYKNGAFTESIAYYSKAMALKPYSIEAKFGLILPTSSIGQMDKVIGLYDQILQIDPKNSVALYRLGLIYYGKLQYDKAKPLFESVVNLYPFDYYGLIMLAWTNYRLGNLREAKVLFSKVLLISPDDADAKRGLQLIK